MRADITPTESYPLAWPLGQAKTARPKKSKFVGEAVQQRLHEIRRNLKAMGGDGIVITSNLPTRQSDGEPRSGAIAHGDQGVAVYWRVRGRAHVMACDLWNRVTCNLRAIALTLEAMRGLRRWGAVQANQVFAGFQSLPPGAVPPPPPLDWRDVLGESWPKDLENDELLALARARHRREMKQAHPDAGGSTERAAELNAAMAAAEAELSE